eukprot:483294-Prorocentrum_minimum.AAC.1
MGADGAVVGVGGGTGYCSAGVTPESPQARTPHPPQAHPSLASINPFTVDFDPDSPEISGFTPVSPPPTHPLRRRVELNQGWPIRIRSIIRYI